MLLNDFSVFQKISANYSINSRLKRSDDIASGFGIQSSSSGSSRDVPYNANELDIDRLLSTSPIITESSTTYYDEITEPYLQPSKSVVGMETLTTDAQKLQISKEYDSKDDIGEESLSGICISNDDQKSLFRAVSPNSVGENAKQLEMNPMGSTLTQLLKQESDFRGSTMKLTVYLPNYSSMEIRVNDAVNIQKVIEHILSCHKEQGLRPPLKYENPKLYELRIHDGDGMPDTDFPALDLNKKMKKFGIDEVCICEVDEFTSNSDSFGGPASRSSIMAFDSRNFNAYPSFRSHTSLDNISERSSSFEEPEIDDNTVVIKFPESRISKSQPAEPVTECVLSYEPGACMIDLLPLIEKKHKLKLYITEYVFAMSDQDKHRLKLMTPLVDMKASVSSIGTSTFLLQKREYADNVKQQKQAGTSNKLVVSNQRRNLPDAVYRYQQWNIIKKNKFGIRQDRVFGVDGENVYNAKRGQDKDNTKVHRAQRKISAIQSIEIMANDCTAFCIKWIEDRETISIEYICESRQHCKEIVQKIKQIIANPTPTVEPMQNKYC